MNYRPITLQDIDLFRPYLEKMRAKTCDFTVGGMFMWRDYYKMEYAEEGSTIYTRLANSEGDTYYNLPLSDDIDGAIVRLIDTSPLPLRFCTVPEPFLHHFERLNRGIKTFEQTNFADYIYNASDIAAFSGKKYHGQRNMINQFMRKYPDRSFGIMKPEDTDRVLEFFRTKYLPHASGGDFEKEENEKVAEVLKNNDKYGFIGGILTVGDSVVGFSLSEIIGDTLYAHIEKADREFSGVYQMLANRTADAFISDTVRFINREEDMGDEGLRFSKESYHPIEKLKKYIVEVN